MDENQMRQFLVTLADKGRLMEACQAAGVEPRMVKALRKTDPEFSCRFTEAMEQFSESLEAAAVARGRDGLDEPVFGSLGGNMGSGEVGRRRVYSDRMLELLLKKNNPAYRERMTVDANLTGGVLVVGPPAKTPEEWEKDVNAK